MTSRTTKALIAVLNNTSLPSSNCAHVHLTAAPEGPAHVSQGIIAGQVEEGPAWAETSGRGSRQEGTTRIQQNMTWPDLGHRGYQNPCLSTHAPPCRVGVLFWDVGRTSHLSLYIQPWLDLAQYGSQSCSLLILLHPIIRHLSSPWLVSLGPLINVFLLSRLSHRQHRQERAWKKTTGKTAVLATRWLPVPETGAGPASK